MIVIARSVSDEAIHSAVVALDCFASLAMTWLYPAAIAAARWKAGRAEQAAM
jgi:hypothetical protein